MAVETELKLTLPAKVARQLENHPLLAGLPVQVCRLLNTYFDTPDCTLIADGVALRFRKKQGRWLMTVKRADGGGALTQREEWEFPAVPGQFDFALIGCQKLRQHLEKKASSLVEVFTTHFTRRSWLLDYGVSRIEVSLDRGRIVSADRQVAICEIELELLSGEIADLFGLALELQAHLPLHPALASKAERGYALYRQIEARPGKALRSRLQGDMSAVAAFRTVALDGLFHLQYNVAANGWRNDPEYTHQSRVALRRLRSALRFFAPVLPVAAMQDYVQQWKTYALVLGKARNWDVFVAETLPPVLHAFPQDDDLELCQRRALGLAGKAHRAVETQFLSDGYAELFLSFSAALFALADEGQEKLQDFGLGRLRLWSRKLRRQSRVAGDFKSEDWHRLRIGLKKLRYALDFMAPVLPGKRLKVYQAALLPLLEKLGRLNDLDTADQLIHEGMEERRSRRLQGWISGQRALLLENLPEALEHWLDQRPPWK